MAARAEFDKVTVGTSTFQTMESGKADFGGFYATWEGVQADMYGPKLNCFTEPDYGVPGNADTIGIITNDKTIKNNPDLVKKFTQATQRVTSTRTPTRMTPRRFSWTKPLTPTSSPNSSRRACRLSSTASTGAIRPRSRTALSCSAPTTSKGAQEYFDFLAEEDAYTDSHDKIIHEAPQAKDLATDEFIGK